MHFNQAPKDIQLAITTHIKNQIGDQKSTLSFKTNNPDNYRFLMAANPIKSSTYEVLNNQAVKAYTDILFHQSDPEEIDYRQGRNRRRFIASLEHPELKLSIYESKRHIYSFFIHPLPQNPNTYDIDIFVFDKLLLERID